MYAPYGRYWGIALVESHWSDSDAYTQVMNPKSSAEESAAPRLDYLQVSPGARRALLGLQQYVNQESGLETSLLHLIEMRASQINGCAFCLNMHSQEARRSGESEKRLYLLSAWREAGCFSPREQAALAWTEAVTLVAVSQIPDEVFATARREFSEPELVGLTMAVVAINSWNRVNVAFRTPADRYRPPASE